MQTVHQTIFFCMAIGILSLNIIGDVKLWHLIAHHQYLKTIKEQAEENSLLSTVFSPRTVRIINTGIYTLTAGLILLVIVALYFQGKYFGSSQLNHTAITLILMQFVNIIFQTCAWPTQMFPNRRITKPMLITDSILSFINYSLLIYMIYQAAVV